MAKISDWLKDIGPWTIYVSQQMKEEFKKETGQEPVWPEHSDHDTNKAMYERGLGGTPINTTEKVCWGYEVAISLARKYVPNFRSTKMGRGFAFREALEALQKAGL